MANGLKIIVSMSDRYAHLIPIFEYLYMKYWGDTNIEIVGYEKPVTNLPFVSLGTQGAVSEWSTDLRRYFEKQDDWFIWMMEDTFIKSKVTIQPYMEDELRYIKFVGRCDLSLDITKRPHSNTGSCLIAHPQSRYRISTQPSIWNKEFLLTYLKNGFSPWDFETQDPKDDGWQVIGFNPSPVNHNEGVRRFDIHKLNLDGMCDEDIAHIKSIAPWLHQ